jgi:hypothetical protein
LFLSLQNMFFFKIFCSYISISRHLIFFVYFRFILTHFDFGSCIYLLFFFFVFVSTSPQSISIDSLTSLPPLFIISFSSHSLFIFEFHKDLRRSCFFLLSCFPQLDQLKLHKYCIFFVFLFFIRSSSFYNFFNNVFFFISNLISILYFLYFLKTLNKF